jgi:hypothetical protein
MAKKKKESQAGDYYKRTEVEMVNIYFLLRWRYKGNMTLCSEELKIGKSVLAMHKHRYDHEAQMIMKENFPQMRIDNDAVPSMDDLIDKCLIRLNTIIDSGKEADKITNALYKLYSLQALKKKLDTEDFKEEDVYDSVNETLKLGIEQIKKEASKKEKSDKKEKVTAEGGQEQ